MNNKNLLLITLLSVIALSTFSCKDCCEEVECVQYNFKIPVEIHAQKDTFHIGDTITFRSRFHHDIEDAVDGRIYKLANYKFYPFVFIEKIDLNRKNGLFTLFMNTDITADTSAIVFHNDGNNSIVFIYDYQNDIYDTTIKLIPNTSGIYYFSIASYAAARESSGKINRFDGRCPARGQDPLYFMNDNQDDNNYHLLALSGDPNIRTMTKERFDRFGGYAFVVVE
ncbi:MAG: hypothetical protein AAFV95_08535 [Bacteroidota bacterium]